MGKDYSLSSELCLSNWTAETLDSSVKHWMKNKARKRQQPGMLVFSSL